MNLRHEAFNLRRSIQRIIATTSPCEVNGRIEDVLFDALAELADNSRRALRREYQENLWSKTCT
jgi:hypothetical protein